MDQSVKEAVAVVRKHLSELAPADRVIVLNSVLAGYCTRCGKLLVTSDIKLMCVCPPLRIPFNLYKVNARIMDKKRAEIMTGRAVSEAKVT